MNEVIDKIEDTFAAFERTITSLSTHPSAVKAKTIRTPIPHQHLINKPVEAAPQTKTADHSALSEHEIATLKNRLEHAMALIERNKSKLSKHRTAIMTAYRTLRAQIGQIEKERIHLLEAISDKDTTVLQLRTKRARAVKEQRKLRKWRAAFNDVLKAKEDEIEKIYSNLLETEDKYLQLREALHKSPSEPTPQ